jgi:O-antigen ligase
MFFYYLFLLLSPFEEHPLMGYQFFHLASVPITPIKVVGVLMLIAAAVMERPRGAADRQPTAIPGLYTAHALFPIFGTLGFGLAFPQTDVSAYLSYGMLLAATRVLIGDSNRLRMTVRMIVFAETFACLWLYKQYYIMHWPRPIGPSSDPNYEALSVVMAIPLSVWLFRFDNDWRWRLIGLGCFPTLVWAIFISQSRGGMLALGVLLFCAWVHSRKKIRFMSICVLGVALATPLAPQKLWQRLAAIRVSGEARNGAEVSTRTRMELLKAGVTMMKRHPVFGVGLNQFKKVVHQYNPGLHEVIDKNYIAHNTYVQIGAEGGLPCLAMYLGMLFVAFRNFRDMEKQLPSKLGGRLDELGAAMRMGLIAFAVASLFLSAEFTKLLWVFVFLSHNFREIAATESKRDMAASRPKAPGPKIRTRLTGAPKAA